MHEKLIIARVEFGLHAGEKDEIEKSMQHCYNDRKSKDQLVWRRTWAASFHAAAPPVSTEIFCKSSMSIISCDCIM